MMSPRELIHQELKAIYPDGMMISDIRDVLSDQLDQKQISNHLYLMKQDCVIEQDEEKRYFLTTGPAVKAPENKVKLPKAPSFADLVSKAEASRAKSPLEQTEPEPVSDCAELDTYAERLVISTEQSQLMDEISTLNQGIAAAEVLDKRSRPDDLDELLVNIGTLASGISDNAPVAASVLNKARDYLKRGYEL